MNGFKNGFGSLRCVAKGLVLAGSGLGLVAGNAFGQERDWCEERYDGRDSTACEVREYTFESDGDLVIDGGLNGGVHVEGWSEGHVLVMARVKTRARSDDRARELLSQIEVEADQRRVDSDGPDTRRRENWSVSYRVYVPRRTDIEVETHNGGVSLESLGGRIRFEALNGGVSLTDLAGDVEGHTTNGGLRVVLTGTRWEGRGMDVETTNGGINVEVPEGYSAELETGTVNGGIKAEFPIQVRGRIGRRLNTTLGEGGATIRVVTTNGGVTLHRGS